jgi:hypothetical protein
MSITRLLSVVVVSVMPCLAVPAFAQTQPPSNPALGLVATAVSAHLGNAVASEGATVFSGDYLSTDDAGSLLVRLGALSLELQASSAAHIYRAPYGAIVELNRGSVIYTTPGGPQNLVIVVSDVRVTPVLSLADLGRVTRDSACDITVYSQRGQVNVQSGSESRLVEAGKTYRVRAENEISYHEFLSPDADNYHKYHDHRPCAPLEMVKGRTPIAPGQSRFLYIAAGAAAGLTVWGTAKALESPSRP